MITMEKQPLCNSHEREGDSKHLAVDAGIVNEGRFLAAKSPW